jgi:thiopurine S-methyltransferase
MLKFDPCQTAALTSRLLFNTYASIQVERESVNQEFWLERWKMGRIGFHQNEVEPFLIRYFPKMEATTVLVPLCGKTMDLLWLAQLGHQVMGIELSPIACEAFFREIAQQPFEKEKKGLFTIYRGSGISLLCGDFFSLTSDDLASVTYIYDRAALIALPPDMRRKYAAHLIRLFQNTKQKKLGALIVTLEYPQETVSGPPFAVTVSELHQLYGEAFEVQHLVTEEVPLSSVNVSRFKDVRVVEHVFELTYCRNGKE